jgi:peptidoglycan-N-acetylglucosamine deacetylase
VILFLVSGFWFLVKNLALFNSWGVRLLPATLNCKIQRNKPVNSYCCWVLRFGLVVLVMAGMGEISHLWAGSRLVITSGGDAKHAVALTFDDGPSPRYTPQILALLKQYQAQATFFVLGCKVEKYPALIKAELEGGHELGNHTYSHPRLLKTNQLARAKELGRTRLCLDLLGCPEDYRTMRPPYSEYDKRLVSYLDHTNQDLILWSVDSGDWRYLNAQAIVHNVLTKVKNGSIIVFHDSDEYSQADRHPTVEALKIILPALQKAGYRMVTVSELLN